MIKKQDLENVVEDISAKLFEQLYPNANTWDPEKQAEEAMATLELVAYVVNNFMLELNKRFESVAEEVLNEKEVPKIFVP
jgi:hypothetical protein